MVETTLFILTKAPIAGRVKTRLGVTLGHGRATTLFSAMVELTVARAREARQLFPALKIIVAVDEPAALGGRYHCWPAPRSDCTRAPQGSGDLGARMRRLAQTVPARPVLFIGADCPDLTAHHLAAAARALGGHDAVMGRADDGGFWLLGLRQFRAAPDQFSGVRWSTGHAGADMLASLPRAFKTAFLPTLNDIDDDHDLRAANKPILIRSRGS